MEIELGTVARDCISGYQGIVVARTRWLYGCVRITIQAPGLQSDGTPIESATFDEAQCAVVAPPLEEATDLSAAAVLQPGGPRPAPTQHAAPVRR